MCLFVGGFFLTFSGNKQKTNTSITTHPSVTGLVPAWRCCRPLGADWPAPVGDNRGVARGTLLSANWNRLKIPGTTPSYPARRAGNLSTCRPNWLLRFLLSTSLSTFLPPILADLEVMTSAGQVKFRGHQTSSQVSRAAR